ncbi:MAG TPA: glycosyltransferase family 1 protein [Gemmataceae bacterium]
MRRLDLPPRYLLYVGTIEPRKNIMTLPRAYCCLPESVRARCPLLLVGGWSWNAGDVADFLKSGARQHGVMYRNYVPESDLAALYNGARALVFPSLYEGFGLPPVEMLACGGAVLASTAGAVVETVGRQAHLIEPLDIDGWREAMRRVVEDDEWWRSLRQGAVAVVKPFTWEQCAADTLRVYRQLCGERGTQTGGVKKQTAACGFAMEILSHKRPVRPRTGNQLPQYDGAAIICGCHRMGG